MVSFINIPKKSDFTIYNIPFGIFRYKEKTAACTRIGDTVIDLDLCQKHGVFEGITLPENIFYRSSLNDFIRLGKPITNQVRIRLQESAQPGGSLERLAQIHTEILLESDLVEMLLPVVIGDYTDFYSSREHATNVGMMFRDPANALLPNWLHLPVGYHGRSSSIVVSGTKIKRPSGQIMPPGADSPIFSKTKRLDFELEMAFVIGRDTEMGTPINIHEAEDYIFGVMLFNDWSARDIQRWEYVPLGPFLAKNFASTVSPWIITLEALEPFRVSGPVQETEVLPYLQYSGSKSYDIQLKVTLSNDDVNHVIISESNFKYLYWNMCQQLTHHTVNGCNVRVGDLMASGTISGPTPDSLGSMLEITWNGTKPLTMPDHTHRSFIDDGDTVSIQGWCEKDNIRIGFGPCLGTIFEI